jgi:hypothetical protein
MDKTLKIALVLTALDKMSEVVDHAVHKSTSRLSKFQHGMNSIGTKSIIAGAGITEFMGEAVEAAEESEIAVSKLKNVYAQMGEKTEQAAKDAEEYAGKLQMQIGVEDEVIMAVETKLATFKKASNEGARQSGLFNRITKAAFDLEAAGFGDAMSNITQLGKAFQDPIHGATALKKAGTLTQKDLGTVKMIATTKGLAAAQEYIIKALEKQVKGTADKNATAAKKAKIAYGELQEKIGNGLVPILNKYMAKVIAIIEKVTKWVEKNPQLVKTIAAIGVALLAFGVVAKVIASVVTVFNTLSTAIKFAGTAFQFVSRIFMMNPIGLIITAIAVGVFLIIRYWDKIKAFFSRLFSAVGSIFKNSFKLLTTVLLNFTPAGLIFKHWNKITAFFMVLWQKVKDVFWGVVKWVVNLGSTFYNAGVNIIKSIWNGIKAMINKPIELIKNMVKKIRNFLPFSPAKEGPLRDIHKIRLVETIAESIKPTAAVKAMQKVGIAIAGTGPSSGGHQASPIAMASGGGTIQLTYAPVIHGADKNIMDVLKTHDRELVKMLEEAYRKWNRTKFA